jgi:phthalate 4,5-dioxygenase
MLTLEENELLAHTGPGTPMGRLLRRYWIPALLTGQLREADGAPLRVKLLGENLVAFRASDGTPGLVDERCPHRNASMFFGRNEEGGLRCVYHGWKFDIEGNCTDMPSEPAESNFKRKVKIAAYPCIERGGLIWTYMGPPEFKPGFPEIEWTLVPDSHRYLTRHIQECNWFQGFEGGFDVTHLSFLHRGADTRPYAGKPTLFEIIPTDHGFITGNGRKLEDGGTRWTSSALLMPFHKLISRVPADAPIGAHAWVPIDDENCMIYSVEYLPERPLTDADLERSRKFEFIHAENLPGSDRPVQNRDNDFQIDRSAQSSGRSFTGIKGIGMQDCGIQESMGRISDRSREHLGKADLHIIRLRKLMLDSLNDLEAGKPLRGMNPSSYRVRSAGFVLRAGEQFATEAPRLTGITPTVKMPQ